MAVITNLATLQTAIAVYLTREDLTTFIPNFIQNAENKLLRTLNLRNEETALSVSVSSGTGTVPTDFKRLKFAYVPDSPAILLRWVSIEELYRSYPIRTGSSTPCLISREGANFTFGPFAKDFTLTGIYWAKQDPLRTTDPSWYVTNAPEVLLYGSLLESAPFIKGDEKLLQELPIWERLYNDAVSTLLTEEKHSSESAGALVQRVA